MRRAPVREDIDWSYVDHVQRLRPERLLELVKPGDGPTAWDLVKSEPFCYFGYEVVSFLESIAEHGVRRPVIVWQDPDTKQGWLTNGHHRLWYAVEARVPSIPVVVRKTFRFS